VAFCSPSPSIFWVEDKELILEVFKEKFETLLRSDDNDFMVVLEDDASIAIFKKKCSRRRKFLDDGELNYCMTKGISLNPQ
jgi:hypothetical protein